MSSTSLQANETQFWACCDACRRWRMLPSGVTVDKTKPWTCSDHPELESGCQTKPRAGERLAPKRSTSIGAVRKDVVDVMPSVLQLKQEYQIATFKLRDWDAVFKSGRLVSDLSERHPECSSIKASHGRFVSSLGDALDILQQVEQLCESLSPPPL